MAIVGERFGARVERWTHLDTGGEVFSQPAEVEVDVVVRNGGEPLLVEIKSSVSPGDVTAFRRKANLYDRVQGVRSRRLIVSPSVSDRAGELARSLGIDVSSDVG